MDRRMLPPEGVRSLVGILRGDGYRVVAPTLTGGTVTLGELAGPDDLAGGRALEVGPGRGRVVASPAMLGAIGGPESMKRWQHPARRVIWQGERGDGGFTGSAVVEESAGPVAFLGVRACDLAGAAILARAIHRPLADEDLVIAVRCTAAAPTCFCTAMGTGPDVAPERADLVLTEVFEPAHRFLAQAGSERGEALLTRVVSKPASDKDAAAADALVARLAATMARPFALEEARSALERPGPGWDAVARRCLACGNCTAVCPTCFCITVVDRTDPAATVAERIMRWDSCFDPQFSEMHGGPVRATVAARYRQWVSHKMSWWWEQFGTAGCVGCGRCIVWCPVGIDIREEVVAAIERSTVNV